MSEKRDLRGHLEVDLGTVLSWQEGLWESAHTLVRGEQGTLGDYERSCTEIMQCWLFSVPNQRDLSTVPVAMCVSVLLNMHIMKTLLGSVPHICYY